MSHLTAPRALVGVAVSAALALGTSTVFGQAAATTQNQAASQPTVGGLEEVVVTARYREENLQQTPIAISAITAEDIEQRGFTTSSDIAYSVPNASFRPAQQAFGNTQTAFIRGIGQNDFNFAFEPGVGIYVDDVYYPTTMASQFDLLDLERVEVLRGPQGTLFGRGSIGGAVRYVSKQPKGDDTGFIEGTVGDFHRVDLRAGYDFSIIDNVLFARITGVSKKQDGYQKIIDFACAFPGEAGTLPVTTHNRLSNCQAGTLGGTDVQGARAQLRWVMTDNADLNLAFDYQRDDSEARADTLMGIGTPFAPGFAAWDQFMFNGTATVPIGPNGSLVTVHPNPSFNGYGVHYDSRFIPNNPYVTYATFNDPYSGLSFPPRTALNQKGVSATLNLKFTDTLNLTVIGAWRNWNGSFSTDQDDSPLSISVVDGLQQFTYRTLEARLNGRLIDNKLDWTIGAFYYDGNVASAQQVQLPGVLPAIVQAFPIPGVFGSGYFANPTANSLLVNGLDHGHFENASGFVHGTYDLTDALQFELGARYSNDKKQDLNDNTIVVQQVNSSQGRFDWRAAVNYKFTSSVMGYASASTGYRPPAFNPRPFQPSQFQPVDGENLTAYELGIKSDLLDHKLRINADIFYSDYKKRIIGASGVECQKNADGSVIQPAPGQPGFPNPEGGAACAGPAATPLTAYVNAPAKIKGAELELTIRPVDELLLTANAGYTKFTSDSVLFERVPFNGITPSGEPGYVPEWTASAAAQYSFNLGNGATISPRVDAFMTTQVCAFPPNSVGYTGLTSCAGGYTLLNARVEYAAMDRKWTTAVGVSNLGDKRYWLNIFDLTAFGEPTIEGQPGAPREWYLTVTRKF
jgi:iron complex outermembrane recepter protein